MALQLDINDLTLGEVEEIETQLGQPIDIAFGAGGSKAKAMRAAAWVLMKRDNPEMSYDDTASIKLTDITMGESPAAVEV